MCQNSTEENKHKNKAKKAVSKAMREKVEEAFTELQNCPYGMLRIMKGQKTESKEVEGGRCERESDGKQCLGEKERGKAWKDYMERIVKKMTGMLMWKEMQ